MRNYLKKNSMNTNNIKCSNKIIIQPKSKQVVELNIENIKYGEIIIPRTKCLFFLIPE